MESRGTWSTWYGRSATLGGRRVAAVLLWVIAVSNCASLFEDDTDSFVSKDFLLGNWEIWSIRLADGQPLSAGENRAAGMPETVWTLLGSAGFTSVRADIQYSVEVAVAADPAVTTAYDFVGEFDVDRTTIWVTQDASGEVVRMNMRRDDAAILVGERMLDNFSLTDGDGNESLWVRR